MVIDKKSLMLGLATLTVFGVACVAILKEKNQEVKKNFGEYQEEAYPIGIQIEKNQNTK